MKLQQTDLNRRQIIIEPKKLIVIVIGDRAYYCKPVSEFDGYFATTCGQVISKKHKSPRLLKPFCKDNKSAYLRIQLSGRTKQLHRAIAAAFLYVSSSHCRSGQPRLEVNHIDGNPKNNKVANLEIVSSKENSEWSKLLKTAKAERAGREVGRATL